MHLAHHYHAYLTTPYELDTKATAQARKAAAKPVQVTTTAPTEANPDESGLLPRPQRRKH